MCRGPGLVEAERNRSLERNEDIGVARMSKGQRGTDDAMDAEFDVVPGWTVDAVRQLGVAYALPAACRGSGGSGALSWLTAQLGLHEGSTLLDSGAGMGGPAALAGRDTGARVVAVEPMIGACRAAVNLFGVATVAAIGQQLPFADGTFDAAWSLGVLSTSTDQPGQLAELARAVRPGGAIGLLVYTRRVAHLDEHLDGNHFPTPNELASMLTTVGLHTRADTDLAELPDPTPGWTHRADAVDQWIERHHGDDPGWAQADTQQQIMARLLGSGQVGGSVVIAAAKGPVR